MNERRDSGLEGYMKGWIQDWRDLGLEGFMTRGTQDKRDTEKNG